MGLAVESLLLAPAIFPPISFLPYHLHTVSSRITHKFNDIHAFVPSAATGTLLRRNPMLEISFHLCHDIPTPESVIGPARRPLRNRQVGVAGMSSFILWFSWQTLWHLRFSFELPLGSVLGQGGGHGSPSGILASLSLSLRQVSVCCAALSFGILLVPGLAAFRVRQVAIGIVFG